MSFSKKIILVFILIYVSQLYPQDTKVEIEYYQAITNKEITKSDEPKILKDLDYVLQFTKTESIFYNLPSMESDGFRSNSSYMRKAGASGVFYDNIKTKEKYNSTYSYVSDKKFLIIRKSKQGKWNLTKETKKIDKYICYKAYYLYTNPLAPEISIPITAWYTVDLPFPFGPLGYEGLPGVILELSFLDYAFVAKKIAFDKKFKIVKPEGEVVTDKEYKAYFKKATGIDLDKQLKERVKENREKKESKKQN